jgi:hypothetical protein
LVNQPEEKTMLRSVIAAAALCAAAMFPASAMPIDNNLAGAETANVEQVRTVCNRYRCWWEPGVRYYGGYGYERRFGGNGRYWGSPYQPRQWSR